MKKLLVLAAVALAGAASLAQERNGGWPRVYQYAASLNTAVAKNAKTVKYTDCEREMDVDVCYRVKGTVSIKGVIVFDCSCVDEEEYNSLPDGYPIILMATSADNYRGVTFAEGDVWTANRLGSPLSSKAKIAELGFDTEFRAGPTNAGACVREYELRHAGFGTAGMVESGDGYDITSIAGTVIGSAMAPYCSADQNTCPRCVDNGECQTAIAFEPCTVDDCAPYDGENTKTGVAFGSFTVKYNKTLASAIKNIPTEEIQETIDVLVPKVFGKNAIAPTYVVGCGCFSLTNTEEIDITDPGWFDACIEAPGNTVKVQLLDLSGTVVYEATGTKVGTWTYDQITSTANNGSQYEYNNHDRIIILNNGDKLRISGRSASNAGCGGSQGNGYGIVIYPPAYNGFYYDSIKLAVFPYHHMNSNYVGTREFSAWTPSGEISWNNGGLMYSCDHSYGTSSPSPLTGFMGTFVFTVLP